MTAIEKPTDPDVDVSPGNVVYLTATQLASAVALVKPHVCTDSELPTVCAYRFDVRNGGMWVSGTDRYSCAAAWVEPALPPATGLLQAFPDGFHVAAPSKLVQQAVAFFKPNRKEPVLDPQLAIEVTEHQVLIRQRTKDETRVGTTLAGDIVDDSVDVLSLLNTALWRAASAGLDAERFGLNSTFLARFAGIEKVVGKNEPIVVRKVLGAGGAFVVTGGQQFVGALMPVHLRESQADDLIDWIGRTSDGPATAVPKP